MRKVIPILAILIFTFIISLAQLADTPCPMSSFDALHTGRSKFNGPAMPKQKWSFVTGGRINGSPCIAKDGTIYIGSNDGNFYAFNPDGTQKWVFKTEAAIQSAPAIAADGTIYVGSKYLYALNPDGTQKWAFTAGGTTTASPVIGKDGTIYLASLDAYFYAINPDGTKKWTSKYNYTIFQSSPALGTDGTIYVGTGGRTHCDLIAFNSLDGSEKWRFTAAYPVAGSPSIGADGTIYFGSYDSNVYALNPDGTKKWKCDINHTVHGGIAIASDGTIYAGSYDNKLYAITSDGKIKWSFLTNDVVRSNPIINADGTIYVGSADDNLYAINSDGTQKWSFNTGKEVIGSSAIGTDGTLYFGSLDNTFYALGNGTPTLAITPPTATLTTGATQQFTATPATGVTWTATGGTISNTGLFTAGNTAGTFVVTAKSSNGTATASVIVTAKPKPTITITTPNGGEKWQQGVPQNIYWTSANVTGNVKVDLYKTGVFLRTISASIPNTGNCTVTLAAAIAPAGTDYRIKISSITDPAVTTMSAADFEITAAAPKSNDPWPMFRHDLQHTGRSPFVGPTYPIEKWTYLVKDLILSSPAIGTDGTIYFSSMNNKIYALNPTGTLKWSFTTGDHVRSSPLLGPDGTIYVGSSDKNVYAINSDGTQKWKFATTNEVSSSPIIDIDGTIYVGSKDGKVYSIKPDGSQKWSFSTGREVDSSPAIGTDGTIYIGSLDTKLYAINPDGTQKWAFTAGGGIMLSSPAIGTDGTIYIGNIDKKVYAVNPDGTKKWTFTTGNVIVSSPAIGVDGTIYIGSNDNKLYALNPNGTQKWAFTAGSMIESSPAIDANGIIYFGAEDNKVYAVNPNGTKKWSINLTSSVTTSSPAIGADGTIYIGEYGTGNDLFYAIGNGTAPTLSITPSTTTITTGATQQFTATPATGVTWTATGGTISNTGLYTAGNTAGTYIVTAKSSNGTATASVIVTAKPTLAAPVQLSPANSAVNIAIPVTIAWQPVNNAVSYKYDIFSAASATVPIETQTVTGTSATIQYNLAAATRYTWRVRAIDANDLQSAYSTTWAFTTQAPAAIGTPVLTFPLNNASGVVINPTLTWQSATNATVYSVEVANNAAFTAPIVSVQNVTATSYNVTGLNNNTKYYWRVKGGNGTIWGSPATASFTTITKPGLAVPVLTSPINGATGAAIATTLTWQPVATAANYTVQYATNNNFSNAAAMTGTAATQNVTLLANTRYYWRVKAIDANDNESNWSSTWYFTTLTQTIQITAPTLITPADGDIDIPVKTTFTWSSVANVIAYDVEISKDAAFTTRSVQGSSTTSLTANLADNVVYYWRVRGKNGNNLGIWSNTGSFTTAAFVPTTGVDAAIANSKVGSPLMGIGVVNNDGALQTVTVDQPINRQSEFNIVVKNTGNMTDNFLITSKSTINAKWKVTVYDIGGADITKKIFSAGWASYSVKPGEIVILRLRFAAASGQTIDAANPPTQSISITAQSWKDITNGVATPASDTIVGSAILVKMAK